MFYLVNRKDDRIVAGYATTDGYSVNGMRVISVPPDVAIDEANRSGANNTFILDDLLEEKYEGILNKHPLFSDVLFDDFSDDSGIAVIGSLPTNVGYGSGVLWIDPGGTLLTSAVVVADPVERALPQWEAYSLERVVEGTSVKTQYVQEDPNSLDVFITNDYTEPDWETQNTVLNEEVFEFPATDVNLGLVFQNNTGKRLYLGGFCILY